MVVLPTMDCLKKDCGCDVIELLREGRLHSSSKPINLTL